MSKILLEVKNLHTHFFTGGTVVKAVDGVNISLRQGETLGIVGESGSGKSITALSIMRLIPSPPGKIVAGEIIFEDRNLLKLSEKEMRNIRGNEIAMIFQDPMTSLNPVLTIGDQIAESLIIHQKISKKEALIKVVDLLESVGISEAKKRIKDYPHQFSGGMRQRVMIAMAMACSPKLLIADEPTTALDVTIQAQILDLMRKLKTDFNTSIIMITHDLGVVAEICENVVVMYAGSPVEYTDTITIFKDPKHPYTLGLLASIPKIHDEKKERLEPINGTTPDLSVEILGCKFRERCTYAKEVCAIESPTLKEVSPGHYVNCHLYS